MGTDSCNLTDIWLCWRNPNGSMAKTSPHDLTEIGVPIDAETGDDLEYVGWLPVGSEAEVL